MRVQAIVAISRMSKPVFVSGLPEVEVVPPNELLAAVAQVPVWVVLPP